MSVSQTNSIAPIVPDYDLATDDQSLIWISCASQGERDDFAELVTPVLSDMCTVKSVNNANNTDKKYCIVASLNDESIEAGKRVQDVKDIFKDQFPVPEISSHQMLSYRMLAKNSIPNIESL